MAEANSVTQSSEQPNKLPEAVAKQNPLPNIPENEAEKSGPQSKFGLWSLKLLKLSIGHI